MGLSQALFSAISGLTNHQRAMDNIGNNLANVNTVAFKKGVFQFRTLFEQMLAGGLAPDDSGGGGISGTSPQGSTGRGAVNPITLGLGTKTGSIMKNFTQGSMEVTGNQRDMAIEGNGYFVLRQANARVYTRDGTFYIGSDGALLGSDGLHVQGVLAEEGEIPEAGDITDLMIPIGQTGAATETTQVALTGNLNSDLEVATGLRLISDVNPMGDADAQSWLEEFGELVSSDGTWNALLGGDNAETFINGGTVQTTAPLAVAQAGPPPYAAANINTDLANLYYLSGTTWIQPFNGISDGDTITTSFRKGGRRHTAEFTYDSTVNSTTLEHLMQFLSGGVDDVAAVDDVTAIENTANTRLQGGAMGTIKLAGKVSTATPGGTSGYDSPVETGGAFTRTYTNAVDYGTGLANSFNVSVVSNLGEENAITDIEMSYNNVKYTDVFSADLNYADVQGGSATTNMVFYDSLGNPHGTTMQMTLVDRDTNFSTWRWVADSTDDTDADWQTSPSSNDITTSMNVGTGLIRFDSEGQFIKGVELSETGGIEITLEDQGVNQPLTISLREGLSSDFTQDLDFSDMTQVAATSDFNLKEQDGTPPGTLDSFVVDPDGLIQGVFSNGVIESLGRITVALIPNENGMVPVGNNIFYEGPASGAGQLAFAGVGGRGQVRAGQLEMSNVNLSEEFTKLITTQRGFQANARVITTSDEMLVELVNMKR